MQDARSSGDSPISIEETRLGGRHFAVLAGAGPLLDSEQSALDLIGEVWGVEADVIVVPKSLLSPAFLDLRSGLLGQVAQKFVNYNATVGIIGDFSAELAASKALRDYFYEANKGKTLLFAADLAELVRLLSGKD